MQAPSLNCLIGMRVLLCFCTGASHFGRVKTFPARLLPPSSSTGIVHDSPSPLCHRSSCPGPSPLASAPSNRLFPRRLLRSNVLAALDPSPLENLPAGPASHAEKEAVSSLLDQPGVSVHRVSRTASDLRGAERGVSRDGARRDDVGGDAGGGGGSERCRQRRSTDRNGERSQGRSQRHEGGEGPVRSRRISIVVGHSLSGLKGGVPRQLRQRLCERGAHGARDGLEHGVHGDWVRGTLVCNSEWAAW